MKTFRIAHFTLAVAAAAFLSVAARAANEGQAPVPTCPQGQIWDSTHQECVKQKHSTLPDSDKLRYVMALAGEKRYSEALEVLDLLRAPDTPVALSYRGYVTRKSGWTESGIKYYLRSIALDPTYVRVREYLGEAYITQGRIDLARGQLSEIKHLCGADCDEYRMLSSVIDKAL